MKTSMYIKESYNQDRYDIVIDRINELYSSGVDKYGAVFTTDAINLWEIYLHNLPSELRQQHNCNACKHFIKKYGGLVFIDEKGNQIPAMWSETYPDTYNDSATGLFYAVKKAKVTGVFLDSDSTWGYPTKGDRNHFAIKNAMSFTHPLKSANQVMAEKLQDKINLSSSLSKYPVNVINLAKSVLKSDALYRSKKVLGRVEWFEEMQRKIKSTKNTKQRNNLIWKYVANAPAGFCHIGSSVVGTLLDDIASNLSFTMVKQRFEKKMHPLQYQRPSTITDGNIRQAEKVIEKLKSSGSLERRFARLEEIEKIWEPQSAIPTEHGTVFGHLKESGYHKRVISSSSLTNITWNKFQKTVLPDAQKIEYLVQPFRVPYTAIVTANDWDAPPIIQWDVQEIRNPFSLYMYNKGSTPDQWGLSAGQFVKVNAITYNPAMWHNRILSHQGDSVIFVLDKCKDNMYKLSGNALFPEILKSDFHSIRKTIEAYSREAVLGGFEDASACGVALTSSEAEFDHTFRVTSGSGFVMSYKLDRWG